MGMDEYAWQKNKAVVDRMYYTERVVQGTTFAAVCFTTVNLLFIRKNFFAAKMRARLMPTFKAWAITNVVSVAVLQAPLTSDERNIQLRKRLLLGKWLYTLFHLEPMTAPEKK